MSIFSKLSLGAKRYRRRLRALRLGRKLVLRQDNLHNIGSEDIIAFVTVHNEQHRIPYFLEYYRALGVNHFIFIDNNSQDNTASYLSQFSDVTRYFTDQSYRRAHFGMDWVNWMLFLHGRGHWTLNVDVDEFLVYPHCDKRPLRALTDWLDASNLTFMPAQLLDMYPEKKLSKLNVDPNRNPFEVLTHFDAGNYSYRKNKKYKNLWIQGGARARLFFTDRPDTAPALNKTPLVRWQRGQVYISSTHQILPRKLNISYTRDGSERICGALLHAKFMPDIQNKVEDPYLLSQHYSRAREYRSYNQARLDDLNFMSPLSVRYEDWRQLHVLGVISQGGWA